MSKIVRFISVLFIVVFALSACNLPSRAPATEEPNAIFTAAALTVQAQLTQSVPFNTPTLPPPPATNTPVIATTAAPPTNTPVVSPTAACDAALFVKDVTIPDGTQIEPGASFTKTWRLRNIGTCTWSGYSLVFDSGESMNGSPNAIGTVGPGQEVDVSVSFTVPVSFSGTVRSYWRLRNASGVLLPVQNGYQGKSFFVEIKVASTSSGFDLHTRAPDATWVSGAGNLTFGGPDTNADGFVMYRNNQKLEDGSSAAKVLEMYPQWVNDGVITGRFPAYTIRAGEHFKAKIGFLALGDGTCGSGNVKFQLNYREAGTLKSLGEWTETCNGTLNSIDVDLSSLAGKNIELVLAVLANGPATQDMAVWVSPQVIVP
ncbi:MAG: hypothetical protein HXY35_16515 [Chloroflexi bacterium]|nr:hypothetical protein [Chloroflexota bacterium]